MSSPSCWLIDHGVWVLPDTTLHLVMTPHMGFESASRSKAGRGDGYPIQELVDTMDVSCV